MRPFRRQRRGRKGRVPAEIVADPLPALAVLVNRVHGVAMWRYRPGTAYGIHRTTRQLVAHTAHGWTPAPRPADTDAGPEDQPDWPAYARNRTRADDTNNDRSNDPSEET